MSSSSWVDGSRDRWSVLDLPVRSVTRASRRYRLSKTPSRVRATLETGVGRTYGQTVNQLLYVTISPTSNRLARSGCSNAGGARGQALRRASVLAAGSELAGRGRTRREAGECSPVCSGLGRRLLPLRPRRSRRPRRRQGSEQLALPRWSVRPTRSLLHGGRIVPASLAVSRAALRVVGLAGACGTVSGRGASFVAVGLLL